MCKSSSYGHGTWDLDGRHLAVPQRLETRNVLKLKRSDTLAFNVIAERDFYLDVDRTPASLLAFEPAASVATGYRLVRLYLTVAVLVARREREHNTLNDVLSLFYLMEAQELNVASPFVVSLAPILQHWGMIVEVMTIAILDL